MIELGICMFYAVWHVSIRQKLRVTNKQSRRINKMSAKKYKGLEGELYDIFRGGDDLDEIGFYIEK